MRLLVFAVLATYACSSSTAVPDGAAEPATDGGLDASPPDGAPPDAGVPFRVSVSVSPFAEFLRDHGLSWSDGERSATSVEDLQRLFMAHGATEVFARIGTRRTLPGADGIQASLAAGVERAHLAQRLGLPLNPELSLFGTYGDLGCQTPPDFSEYPEIALSGPWGTLGIEERAGALRTWARLAAQELVAAGVTIEVWDLGNEVDFGTAGVAVRPMPGSSCDGAEGSTTWYQAPDALDPAIGLQSGMGLMQLPVADRIGWLQAHLWPFEAQLIAAAADGVRQIVPDARFSTHIASWWSDAFAVAFFDAMAEGGYEPDQIGLSYYPTASLPLPSGRNPQLATTVTALRARFDVPVFIAELGYPGTDVMPAAWTGWDHALPGYPLTEQGQYDLIRDLAKWGAAGHLAGLRPWGPELPFDGWPMSFFRAPSAGGVSTAVPALDAIADGIAAPDGADLHD